jgi:hypothetical protein
VEHGVYVICGTFRDFDTIRVPRCARVCYMSADERVSYAECSSVESVTTEEVKEGNGRMYGVVLLCCGGGITIDVFVYVKLLTELYDSLLHS